MAELNKLSKLHIFCNCTIISACFKCSPVQYSIFVYIHKPDPCNLLETLGHKNRRQRVVLGKGIQYGHPD